MSDLISRSALLENIKSRKYISTALYEIFATIIDEQPIAYDKEAVVEKLEQQAEQYRRRGFEVEQKGFSREADKYYGKQCSYLHSVAIVKGDDENE